MDQNYNNQATTANRGIWPGAFGAYKPSRDAVMRSLGALVSILVLNIVASILLVALTRGLFGASVGSALYDVCSIVLSALFIVMEIFVYLKSIRGKRVELSDAFKAAKPLLPKMILLEILIGLTIIAGLILLIIPGIYFALRLSFAPYYLVDRDMEVMDAYKASWHATKGNIGKVLGIIGVYILMVLPCITIIGILATIYLTFMYAASLALLYDFIIRKKHNVSSLAA